MEVKFGQHGNSEKPVKIRYQQAVCMNPAYCRMCWNANPRIKLSFAMMLSEKFNTFPTWRIPYFKQRIRAMVKKHYKETHPEYEVI